MCRLPGDTPVAVNLGFSYAGHKNNGVRVGAAGVDCFAAALTAMTPR